MISTTLIVLHSQRETISIRPSRKVNNNHHHWQSECKETQKSGRGRFRDFYTNSKNFSVPNFSELGFKIFVNQFFFKISFETFFQDRVLDFFRYQNFSVIGSEALGTNFFPNIFQYQFSSENSWRLFCVPNFSETCSETILVTNFFQDWGIILCCQWASLVKTSTLGNMVEMKIRTMFRYLDS